MRSFIKISFLRIHFWKEFHKFRFHNSIKVHFFLVFLKPIKCLKFLLPKETLLDTTAVLISILFIKEERFQSFFNFKYCTFFI